MADWHNLCAVYFDKAQVLDLRCLTVRQMAYNSYEGRFLAALVQMIAARTMHHALGSIRVHYLIRKTSASRPRPLTRDSQRIPQDSLISITLD